MLLGVQPVATGKVARPPHPPGNPGGPPGASAPPSIVRTTTRPVSGLVKGRLMAPRSSSGVRTRHQRRTPSGEPLGVKGQATSLPILSTTGLVPTGPPLMQ